jgi:hypothetical protein
MGPRRSDLIQSGGDRPLVVHCIFVLQMSGGQVPGGEPRLEFGDEDIYIRASWPGDATHRQIALPLPSLDGAFVPIKVGRDILPAANLIFSAIHEHTPWPIRPG